MRRLREVPATVAAIVGSLAIGFYAVASSVNVLFGLVSASALLAVAYVVDTGTGPRVDDLQRREAAMLVAALAALLLAFLAFGADSGRLIGAAASAAALAIALVVANWHQRRVQRA